MFAHHFEFGSLFDVSQRQLRLVTTIVVSIFFKNSKYFHRFHLNNFYSIFFYLILFSAHPGPRKIPRITRNTKSQRHGIQRRIKRTILIEKKNSNVRSMERDFKHSYTQKHTIDENTHQRTNLLTISIFFLV